VIDALSIREIVAYDLEPVWRRHEHQRAAVIPGEFDVMARESRHEKTPHDAAFMSPTSGANSDRSSCVAWAEDVSAVARDRILRALANMGQQSIVLSDYKLDGQPERLTTPTSGSRSCNRGWRSRWGMVGACPCSGTARTSIGCLPTGVANPT
jgi:hypothetical protein